jgi:hypothetical protein
MDSDDDWEEVKDKKLLYFLEKRVEAKILLLNTSHLCDECRKQLKNP